MKKRKEKKKKKQKQKQKQVNKSKCHSLVKIKTNISLKYFMNFFTELHKII